MLPEEGPDRAFVQDLAYVTVRRRRAIRFALAPFVKRWPKGELEALLYVGAAQILYMPDVPDFAAVNETVEAAKESDKPSVARVVNGVLRSLIRGRAETEARFAAAGAAERESFPDGLYARWERRFGADGAERLAKWHNEPAETYLAYPDRFEKLPRGRRVQDVEGYAEGRFIVQDPGTRFAVELLSPGPGDEVLDLCAAPGGKTVQIAWRGAKVVACEVNPRRRRRLEENLARVRLSGSVDTVASPEGMEAAGRVFPKVLADVPCSNTGVLRRRPDARWNWSEEGLSSLVRLQASIADRAAALVAPGGLLVYSTCSNEPEENQGQVASFLARHPGFSLERETESIPFESGCDGSYAAALRRAP